MLHIDAETRARLKLDDQTVARIEAAEREARERIRELLGAIGAARGVTPQLVAAAIEDLVANVLRILSTPFPPPRRPPPPLPKRGSEPQLPAVEVDGRKANPFAEEDTQPGLRRPSKTPTSPGMPTVPVPASHPSKRHKKAP